MPSLAQQVYLLMPGGSKCLDSTVILTHNEAMRTWSGSAAAAALLLIAVACGGGSTPSALSESARATFYAADAGDGAGAIVSGDFNHDGVADVLVTAPLADGPKNDRPDAGEAYIFLGPFSPSDRLDAAAESYNGVIHGAASADRFGRTAAAGDFNGDGIDDFAVGAPYAARDSEVPQAGVVYMFFGSESLGSDLSRLDMSETAADATILGAEANDTAGYSLASADLNADGASDLIIGVLRGDGIDDAQEDAGEVYVILGGSIRPRIDLAAGEQDVTFYGAEAGDHLGETVAAADINGDGRADVIAAATFADGPGGVREDAGETYVFLSPAAERVNIAKEVADVTINGVDPGDQIGHSLASGDVDGDRYDDLWLASVSADGPANGADLAGEAHLVFGGNPPPPLVDAAAGDAAAVIYAPEAVARLGRSAATADINGDGLSDLLIAAPNMEQRRGLVYVLFGRARSVAYPQTASGADLVLTGLDAGDILGHETFGTPPLGAADMDADGYPEILVAAPMADGPDNDRADAGEAYIIFLTRAP